MTNNFDHYHNLIISYDDLIVKCLMKCIKFKNFQVNEKLSKKLIEARDYYLNRLEDIKAILEEENEQNK